MCICAGWRISGEEQPIANCSCLYRQELLQWLNGLCSLNLTRVEQCGTGYLSCHLSLTYHMHANHCFQCAFLRHLRQHLPYACPPYLLHHLLQLTPLPSVDMPMARVKFNASADYAYLDNFKILSNAFRKHHVDRPIPVEQLVKCKMQDNLEFLQWTKRFWDQHYPGTPALFSSHTHVVHTLIFLLP
jgi:RP/EB family microtubule-associated protein